MKTAFYCESSVGRIYEVVVLEHDDIRSEIHDVDLPPSHSYFAPTRLLGATREQARLNALEDLKTVLSIRKEAKAELEGEIAHLEKLIHTPVGDT